MKSDPRVGFVGSSLFLGGWLCPDSSSISSITHISLFLCGPCIVCGCLQSSKTEIGISIWLFLTLLFNQSCRNRSNRSSRRRWSSIDDEGRFDLIRSIQTHTIPLYRGNNNNPNDLLEMAIHPSSKRQKLQKPSRATSSILQVNNAASCACCWSSCLSTMMMILHCIAISHNSFWMGISRL